MTRELTDTRDLARLLYAALTGYWPGPGSAGSAPGLLPPAPENGAGLCTPRQVSAGVPAGIDDVTCRALFQRPNRHGPALSTAATFADALASAAPPMPLPFSPAAAPAGRTATRGYGYQPDGSAQPVPADGRSATRPAPRTRPGGGRKPPAERSTAARAIISVVIVLVLAAVGVAAWSISRSLHHSADPGAEPAALVVAGRGRGRPAQAGQREQLQPARQPPGSNEDSGDAGNAIDGSASTFWHTSYYVGNPVFGGLKKGTGLLLDMGRPVRLSQVLVQFGTSCCAHVQIEIGNNNNPVASALSTFTVLQGSATAHGQHDVQRDQERDRPLRPDLAYLPPAADRIRQSVRGADLQRHRARFRRGPVGLMRDAGRRRDWPSDHELLRRHVAGDAEAFGELFRRHRDRLWAVALRTVCDPEEAADALQDAMVSAFRRAADFRGESAVTTWLHRIVVNASLDRLRRRAARPALSAGTSRRSRPWWRRTAIPRAPRTPGWTSTPRCGCCRRSSEPRWWWSTCSASRWPTPPPSSTPRRAR